jgi:serine/threonine protein kinase
VAPPPTSFGKYRILERVAVGSLTEIYKARLDGIGGFHRTFAIKRILPSLAARRELVELLIEEARVAGLLSHANIVQIMDLGEVDGTTFIAMEFIDGPDLAQALRACRERGITLPVPHAIFIAMEMLKGLEYAHQRQVMKGGQLVPLEVVHRDVSPRSVLLSRQGEVKLTDFGVPWTRIEAAHPDGLRATARLRSPEELAGEPVDLRADLFGVGAVLYEMLTGRPPFERAATGAIQSGEHEPASSVNPDVPYGLERIIERALLPGPRDRYDSATTMKDALDSFFHEAGFIFSHSTLAAFLKGLSTVPTSPTLHPGPDDAHPEDSPASEDHSDTRPIPELSFEDDEPSEARPTRLADEHHPLPVPLPGAMPAAPPLPEPASQSPVLPFADDGDDELILDESDEVPSPPRPVASAVLSPPPLPVDPSQADLSRVETNIRAVPPLAPLRPSPMLEGLQDMSQSVSLGQVAGLGDEATLIRDSPVPGSFIDWSNAATNIRLDPTLAAGGAAAGESIEDGILLPDPDDWNDAETRIRPSPPEVQAAAAQQPPPTRVMSTPTTVAASASAPPPSRSSGLQQLVYLLVGAAVTVAVLFVGFVLGMRAADLVNPSSGVPEGTPRIYVEAPAGTQVTINDQSIEGPGPHHLAPGIHMVRLMDGDAELSKSRLELRQGEHRILSYQLREVEAPEEE